MADKQDFPALRRRKRYLEQEMYTYDKYLRSGDMTAAEQARAAHDAADYDSEINEIEYVLRYFERNSNGYHLSRVDWILLIGLAVLAVSLAVVAAAR